jgi:hypothetical protein
MQLNIALHLVKRQENATDTAGVPLNVTLHGQNVKCSIQVQAWAFNTKK